MALLCVLVLGPAAVPSTASAQVRTSSSLRLHSGVGGGLMVSEDQLGYLGYDGIAGRGWVAVGHALTQHWILEAHGSGGIFGSSGADGGLFELGAGMRLDSLTPMQTMRLSPAAHVNMGITGGEIRATLSASLGLFIDLSPAWSLGPVLQYGQVFQPDGERYSSDARYFSFGVGISYRPAITPAPAAPAPDFEPAVPQYAELDGGEPPPDVEPTPELMVLIESAVEPLAVESRHSSELLPPILFEHDSTELIACGEASLFYARDAINAHGGAVTLEGHADTTGDVSYNDELAMRRAALVRDWLVTHGVPAERLRLRSRGEGQTLAEETDDSRRQINRRVIIHFEDPPAQEPAQ